MSVNRRDANLQKLKEADDIQEKTRAAVLRIQQTVVATEEIAVTSLDELRKQGQQMVIFLFRNHLINMFLTRFFIPLLSRLPLLK